MFRNVKLSHKLIAGFAVVALITLLVGVSGWLGVRRLSGHIHDIGDVRLPGVSSLLVIEKNMESLRVAMRTLLVPDLKPEDRARQFSNIETVRQKYQEAWKVYEALPKTAEEAGLWEQFKPAVEEWKRENNEFLRLAKELEATGVLHPTELLETLERFRGDHYKVMADVLTVISTGVLMTGGDDAAACNFGKWLKTQAIQNPKIQEALSRAAGVHEKFHQGVGHIGDFIMKGKQFEAIDVFQNEMQPAAEAVFGHFQTLTGEALRAEEIYEKMSRQAMGPCIEKQRAALGLLNRIVQATTHAAGEAESAADGDAAFANVIAFAGMAAGVAAALGLGILLSLSISHSLRRIIAGLAEGAEQVSSAAGQVSAASQSLAAGSSQQAAGIEETSASLEEMSSMTRHNADNAGQADALMKEAMGIVEAASRSMHGLTASMQEISKASEETSKIIRTIDEIAFQTNLLALNAAVEAARAGEAGAGFAVVADEVRNLAMRAADAARNTSGLIEDTVKKVEAGSQTVGQAAAAFTEVAGHTTRVSELVAEIAAASNEQAQGITQVNTAVVEIDKVTQQNAANAEESASAAEEMSSQSDQMKGMVDELLVLVEGGGKNLRKGNGWPAQESVGTPTAEAAHGRRRPRAAARKKLQKAAAPSPSPEQVIPLDDAVLTDF
jgi:methyl-accepting chemotaxis protein